MASNDSRNGGLAYTKSLGDRTLRFTVSGGKSDAHDLLVCTNKTSVADLVVERIKMQGPPFHERQGNI